MTSAMRAASQLPGRGPTVVDMALILHVNQKSDDDDGMIGGGGGGGRKSKIR